MKQQSIAFGHRDLTLDGILSLPTNRATPFPGVVLCHPHTLFGGSMSSPVMQALSSALDIRGLATLRFNFRGVGLSEGTFDQGKGEQDDLKLAIDTLKRWPGVRGDRIGIAGVSFGAVVALDCIAKLRNIKAIAALSPTLSGVRRSKLHQFKWPKLVVVGEKDLLVPAKLLQDAVNLMTTTVDYRIILGADHTWGGYENLLADQSGDFLAEALR